MERNLEQEIFETARSLFLKKGYDETSISEVARMVGCNQTLVSYYYRTKDKLYGQVFKSIMDDALGCFGDTLKTGMSLSDTISNMLDVYFDYLIDNPDVPQFLIGEFFYKTDRRAPVVDSSIMSGAVSEKMATFAEWFAQAKERGMITRNADVTHLLLDVFCLCLSTFTICPLYSEAVLNDPNAAGPFLDARKKHIRDLLLNSLVPGSLRDRTSNAECEEYQ